MTDIVGLTKDTSKDLAEDKPKDLSKSKTKSLTKCFKELHDFDKRKTEAERVRRKYPTRIPVICERAPKSDISLIDKKKYLVPQETSISQFLYIIRKRMRVTPDKSVFIYVNGVIPLVSDKIMAIYDLHKDEDGFLYFTYTGENTFGKR